MIPKPFHAASVLLGCCLLLVLLPFQSARADSKPLDAALALQTLEDFHAAGQIQARKPVNDVDTSYRYKLEKFQKTAQADGNLKSVVAAKRAIEDLDAGRPLFTSDDPGVADIQTAYIAQRQKAVAESEKALAKVDQDHLASLKDLVVKLTKAGQIDQALEVQAAVDKLNASLTTKSTPATPPQEGKESDIWRKKALDEFPALQDPASELSRNVKALKEKRESMNPSFFKNPQWPYLLTKEVSLSLKPTLIVATENSFEKFEGNWTVKTTVGWTQKYKIDKNGNVQILEARNDSTSEVNKGYGTRKLYKVKNDVMMDFIKTKLQRLSIVDKKLHVEMWIPPSDYYAGKPPFSKGVSLEEVKSK